MAVTNQTVLLSTATQSFYTSSGFFTTSNVDITETQMISSSMDHVTIDAIDVFGFLAVSFGWFICVPIIVFYLYKIHQISGQPIMKHRHLSSIYTLNGLMLCTIILLQVFTALFTVWNISMYKIQSVISISILYLMNAIFILPIFILFALKTYLLYFEQKYQLAIMNMTWLKHINSGVTDWYITKRHTFGEFNYLVKISLIPYTLQILTYIIVQLLGGKPLIFHILTLLFTSLPLLIALILFCRVRGFDDLFGIKDEIKYQCIVIFIMLTIYLSLFLSFEYLPSTPILTRVEWITYIICLNVLFFGISMTGTAYPVYLNLYGVKDPNDRNNRLKLQKESSSLRIIYHKGHTKQLSSSSKNGDTKCLKSSTKTKHLLQCISNEKWFIQFMQHLVYEFSTENLLFLVELIQVKCAFQELHHGVIKVPKSIYYMNESIGHSSIHSSSLLLNIGNYSFSQQSQPSQTQIVTTPPKMYEHINNLCPQISIGSDENMEVTPINVNNISDDENPFNNSMPTTPLTLESDTNHCMMLPPPTTPLTLELSIQSSTKSMSRSNSKILNNLTVNNLTVHNKQQQRNKKVMGSLKIDTTNLRDISNSNKEIHHEHKEDPDLNINNDLFQVIDFNAESPSYHHNHSSSHFLGNKSPSLGSMILNDNYPETEETENNNIPKHKQSCSTSMISIPSKRPTLNNRHRSSTTSIHLPPTLHIPHSRKFSMHSMQRKRSNSDWNKSVFSYLFTNDGKILHRVGLPSGLPPSKILINHNNIREQMIALYDKYIGNQSIHELNLPFNLRQRMKIIFEAEKLKKNDCDKTLNEYMYNILDEVACSILKLMRDSFNRFKYIPKINKKKQQQTSLEIAIIKPILRNANSYSDIINSYSSNNNNTKIKDIGHGFKISL